MSVSLVIVNYRSSAWLKQLLPTAGPVDEIVVVDHSEQPSEAEKLSGLELDRLLVRPNRGYGAGLNTGAAESSGEILILANPDIRFEPRAIELLTNAAARPGVGAAGPIIYWDPQLRWQLPHATHFTWRFELATVVAPRLARRMYLRQQLLGWTADDPVSVPTIGGAALAMSRSVFEDIGGFDERYFLFFEENDLCRRLQRTGRRTVIEPHARIIHPFGRSIGEAADTHYHRSLELFRRSHFPASYRALVPSPPPPRRPRVPPPVDDTAPGDELLLAAGPHAIPVARAVVRSGDFNPAELVPSSASPGRYLLLRRRRGRLGSLGWIRVPG